MVLFSGNTASGAGHQQRCCHGGEQHFWESLLNNFYCIMRLKNPQIYFICLAERMQWQSLGREQVSEEVFFVVGERDVG